MRNLFIAVSTGQGVANLPSILHFAEANDHVVWLESPWAAKEGWSVGPSRILKNRGLSASRYPVSDLMIPGLVREVALRSVQKVKNEKFENIYIILNGGPKLVPIGLTEAGKTLAKEYQVTYLYGDDKPVRIRQYHDFLTDTTPQFIPYHSSRMLSLPEIVSINGRKIQKTGKIWYPSTPPSSYETPRDRGKQLEKEVFELTQTVVNEFPHPERVIKEVCWGAEIKKDHANTDMEIDVGIVLNNGVVIWLECKTGKINTKDIQSRVYRLIKLSSNIARLFIVTDDPEKFKRKPLLNVQVISPTSAEIREILKPYFP